MPIPQLSPAPGESYDRSEKPPPFGHALKHYFAFDSDYVNLNHGVHSFVWLRLRPWTDVG